MCGFGIQNNYMSKTHINNFATDLKQTSNRPPVLDHCSVMRSAMCGVDLWICGNKKARQNEPASFSVESLSHHQDARREAKSREAPPHVDPLSVESLSHSTSTDAVTNTVL